MENITFFETYEQAHPTLDRLLQENTDVQMRIGEKWGQQQKPFAEDAGGRGDYFRSPTYRKALAEIGVGFELTCVVNLSVDGEAYVFFADDVGPYFNHMDDHPYSTITGLVDGVRQYLAEENRSHNGATIRPFLYTVAEEIKTGEDEKKSLREGREKLGSLKGKVPTGLIGQLKEMLSAMLGYADIPMRGLNAVERAEFEKLFYVR